MGKGLTAWSASATPCFVHAGPGRAACQEGARGGHGSAARRRRRPGSLRSCGTPVSVPHDAPVAVIHRRGSDLVTEALFDVRSRRPWGRAGRGCCVWGTADQDFDQLDATDGIRKLKRKDQPFCKRLRSVRLGARYLRHLRGRRPHTTVSIGKPVPCGCDRL